VNDVVFVNSVSVIFAIPLESLCWNAPKVAEGEMIPYSAPVNPVRLSAPATHTAELNPDADVNGNPVNLAVPVDDPLFDKRTFMRKKQIFPTLVYCPLLDV
jgi:hypothetical protein